MDSYGAVTGESVPLGTQQWPARTVPVAGVDVLVRDTPSTSPDLPPAVFVHGLGGSSLNWTTLGLLLGDTVRGIAPDLPGFGGTPPAAHGRIDDHADVVAELWDAEFGDEPVHLFGNSMGGSIAVRLAARRPERVASLTLISPALPHPRASATALWFAALATPRLGAAVLERSKRLPFEQRLQAGYTMIFGDPKALPPEVRQAYKDELRMRDEQSWGPQATLDGARSILLSYLAPRSRSLWMDAAKVTCPVLLVYGGRDRLVNAGIRTKAQSAFPDARLLYLPRTGHVAQMEHPQEVARAFRQLAAK
ncbi:alpha/beta hydrolase [Kribbella lupini]|uniref:Alpha/beta hydrolase n=1 Tax=Kribbella lupini TaxID=291602 RepID=A0ABP4MM79_9ACTN